MTTPGDTAAAKGYRDVTVTMDDGVDLAVRDYGMPGASHTVVFVHGLCLSQVCWARQIDALVARFGDAVRVISYDHRGHGRSGQAPMCTYRIERLAEDLAQVMTVMQVSGPLTLVGHSMGGMTALGYLGLPAGRRPVEPAGLVLLATAAGMLRHRGMGRLLGTPATAALFGIVDRAPEVAVKALVAPLCATLGRWRRGAASAVTVAAVATDALAAVSVATAVGFLPALRDYDQYPTLATIRARTVVVSGGADPLTPAVHARDLAAGIPGAEHVHVPGAGHMLPQEAASVVHQAIRRAVGMDAAPRTDVETIALGEPEVVPVLAGVAS
ncbi:MAG: alpha/beta hydrolase [Mycobacterium sp.]|nr:alpha/beta hydrolase [Mycobacterium sp.]